ncbi:MAG: 6-phosphogluconolactonase [Simkaniaceae bacterium]|nr:6-phosphogluconolactonase [Simkaniaceae bacterium]
MEKQIDERRVLSVPGDLEATLKFCVEHFIQCAKLSIANHDHFYVALSGGSTPKEIFKRLSSDKYKEQLDWTKVHLFWSDERCVAPDHKDSNYKMAMDAGLGTLNIPEENIHRMVGERDAQEGAKNYEETISSVLGSRPFDLVMLGMGDDGHTASLFPGTEALKETERKVVANFVPQKETWRLTMTQPFINTANHIVFYVMGDKKQEMLKEVLSGGDYPSAHIGSAKHKALWIADHAAATLLGSAA